MIDINIQWPEVLGLLGAWQVISGGVLFLIGAIARVIIRGS